MHSADRDISISVVIDNSVPEKSLKSVIMDNVAPDKSDVVNGANNSSSYTKLYSGLHSGVKSPVIYTKVFSNRS